MQINVNTDRTIDKHQGLDEHVQSVVEGAIGRFEDQVHRVEVHLSNENSQKQLDGGNRCMMEAHVTGYAPVVVNEHAVNLHQAITQAGSKLKRALDSALGRLADKAKREPMPIGDVDGDLVPEQDKNLTAGM
ncbi:MULTISPECIES: HPF/RaiA family ribosome-associated protein [unclassified Massilia]|uniref:HPF/RaiA family ribosome-associated protein n=1 Tax=unclassified Massilia TaxID=2609279 RepID=UPI001786237A|nr:MULTISPECIES: HPF/RaiA family ribosome-associated protein [unclassified Massilia]MBD8533025.1 HPF/RaiA family ribosome-associated protein [Massilia sp. CFBP 13647]MBD8676385.1 HPF/RaiA family ribosome-associated protein [Massilia sp. CFBP 13721]